MTEPRTDGNKQGARKPGDVPVKPILKRLAPTPAPLKHHALPPVTPVPDETVPATRALAKAAHAKPAPGTREEEALLITREIKRTLKDIAIGHVHAGRLLARMRDEKLYTALGYTTLEEYAKARFGFESSTLYKHIKSYEWVRANQPAWLKANPKGYIPDQSDLQDLVWVDQEIQKPELADTTRANLEALKAKAFEGKLRKKDLASYKRKGNTKEEGRKSVLASVRALRKRCKTLADMPSDVIAHLEAIIVLLKPA